MDQNKPADFPTLSLLPSSCSVSAHRLHTPSLLTNCFYEVVSAKYEEHLRRAEAYYLMLSICSSAVDKINRSCVPNGTFRMFSFPMEHVRPTRTGAPIQSLRLLHTAVKCQPRKMDGPQAFPAPIGHTSILIGGSRVLTLCSWTG